MQRPRQQQPGEWITAAAGSVFLIGYHCPITVAIEAAVQADFAEFYGVREGPIQLLIHNAGPPLPLPPVEVRAMWRQMPREFPRIDAVALVSAQLQGLAGTMIATLIANLVSPFLHLTVRIYTDYAAAVAWLSDAHAREVDAAALAEALALVCAPPT